MDVFCVCQSILSALATRKTNMLNFYTDMLEDLVKEDGLAILGEGLGVMKLVAGAAAEKFWLSFCQ